MGLTASALGRFRAAAAVSLTETFRERLAALGENITLGTAAPVKVLVATGDITRELVEGGFADAGTVRLKFLAADIPVLPALGSAATFQARPYRVQKVRLIENDLIGEMELRPLRR